jgi:flagellar protein FliO/FliZ
MARSALTLVALTLAAVPALAFAQAQPAAARPFASPDVVTALPAGGIGSIGEVTLALLVVLGAVFGVAWVIRRLRTFSVAGTQTIEIIASVGLGARERAVLLKVGGAQVLVGVAPGRVSALHVLPAGAVLTGPLEPPDASIATVERPSFRSLLLKGLGK